LWGHGQSFGEYHKSILFQSVKKIKDILCLNFCNVDGLDSSNTYTADLENEKL